MEVHRKEGRVIEKVGRTVNLMRDTHEFTFRDIKFHKPVVAPSGNIVNIGPKSRDIRVGKDFFLNNIVVGKKADRRRETGRQIIFINKR